MSRCSSAWTQLIPIKKDSDTNNIKNTARFKDDCMFTSNSTKSDQALIDIYYFEIFFIIPIDSVFATQKKT